MGEGQEADWAVSHIITWDLAGRGQDRIQEGQVSLNLAQVCLFIWRRPYVITGPKIVCNDKILKECDLLKDRRTWGMSVIPQR